MSSHGGLARDQRIQNFHVVHSAHTVPLLRAGMCDVMNISPCNRSPVTRTGL